MILKNLDGFKNLDCFKNLDSFKNLDNLIKICLEGHMQPVGCSLAMSGIDHGCSIRCPC
jgi:hypothetical protein